MFSKRRPSVHKKRSHKNRSSNYFSIESLERREMFAADLTVKVNQLVAAPVTTKTPVAVVANVTPGGASTGSGGSTGGSTSAAFTAANIAVATTAQFEQVSPVLGATFNNGVLTVTGSDSADNIEIFAKDGTLYVREVVTDLILFSMPYGLPVQQTTGTIGNAVAFAFPGSQLKSIVVNANGGDDWVKVDESLSVPVTMNGGSGNDTLMGGKGADYLNGGTGDDKILGGGGNDVINGDQGNDLLIGGDGNDIIHGGDGDDYLLGGAGDDWLLGENGDDKLFGEAGNDYLFGGPGQNLMDGGAGNDQMYGGDGIDAMYGGDGDDMMRGLGGDDRMRGEAGNDDIGGGAGADIIDAGDGNDYVSGDAGNDVLVGGKGNDTMYGGTDQDWLSGEDGADALFGNEGNDYIQGGLGADQIDGGTGSNLTYQTEAPGVTYGTVTQALSWGDVGDFFGDVWDGVVGAFNWTVDKAKSIGSRFWDWASHMDDRIVRLGTDLAGSFTNWPWEADFWKGLGRSVVDSLEIVGLGEAWEVAFEILKPWQRAMTSDEINVAKSVFGNSIPWDRVRMDEHSLMAWVGRTHTIGFIINSTDNIDDYTMIHELTHVWQYVTDGLVYIAQAVGAQAGDGYDYGGVANLRTTKAAGQGLRTFNREQQGQIVADYFNLIKSARAIEATGGYAPATLREQLDVYIYFVKEVSTLTTTQLDTPNPPIVVSPVVGQVLTTNLAIRSTSTPTTPPAPGGSNLNNVLAVNAAILQLATPPASEPVVTSKPTATDGATLSTQAVDAAFDGIGATSGSNKKSIRKK
jgi:Ca2+-binding RTX toxin-like protein